MAKLYSSLFILLFVVLPSFLIAQNVGVGTSTPREKLEVAGGVLIGTTSGTYAGTIRYNTTTNKFEGHDNTSWKPFGSGSGESLWKKNGINIYPDTPQYSGNVGIGTLVPLTKLHVKGNGIIALRAETANDTLPALDVINTTGVAIKAKGDKGSNAGAIESINMDSAGYAIKLINNAALDTVSGSIKVVEGGNAALLIGDLDMKGTIRNSDATLYGGSVAVNDGLTVGSISGASCIASTPAIATFDSTINFDPLYGPSIKTYTMRPVADLGECRKITNFYFEATVADQDADPLDFSGFVRGGAAILSVYQAHADLNLGSQHLDTFPNGNFVDFYNISFYYYSTWASTSPVFNGQDPDATSNWGVTFEEYSLNVDYLIGFLGKIYYNWADSTNAPTYAAFGEVRASGSLYANSTTEYGDLAEFFKVSSIRKPEPGDIVSISKTDNQTFELTAKQYDPLIAGVISENPSVFLNNPSEGDPVALTGRVKVKVNLEGGRILRGDPVTSSSIEGVGMKADKDGIILGYALEAFDGSRADAGKIWILLSKGHLEKIDPSVNVHLVNTPEVKGMQLNGARKVTADEDVVLVPWDKQLSGKIPADVEFDDLSVELTPFGGDAKMLVKDVDENGITVEIIQRSAGFKGFYYKTDILSSLMETIQSKEKSMDSQSNFGSYEDRVTYAKELYKKRKEAFEKLQSESGVSLQKIKGVTDHHEISLYKYNATRSWKEKTPELYKQYISMGEELGRVINNDQSIVRKMREN